MRTFPEIMNTTMMTEDVPLLMPRWGYVASAFVLFLIGFFGFFLNLMAILLMFKDRQLWTPFNVILFNLVCSDFSVSVLGNPFTLISALFHQWVFGHTMCVLYGFFMSLLGITSITTLTVISFERYMMVTRPFRARHLSPKGATMVIVFIWSYSLALTTPPLMGWGNYVHEAANISCSVNWHEQSTNTLTYILFLFAMGQIVPFAVIIFSYVNIIRTMKQNSARLGRVNRAEARATATVFIMIIAFTVAWTPYSIFALMEQFATNGIISPGVGVIPALVAKSSICYDPLIYVGMNTQFRQSINRVFGIDTQGTNSQTDRKYNTVTSVTPTHKVTSLHDAVKYNAENISSAYLKKRDKKVAVEISEATNIESNRVHPRNSELCTIPERNTSDVEKSGETIYEYVMNVTDNKKTNHFSETFKLVSESSPILDIIDTERVAYAKKSPKQNKECTKIKNTYGNLAFEKHSTDDTNDTSHKNCVNTKIKHSSSLDFNTQNDNKRRRLSIEARLETLIQPEGFSDAVRKFFDPKPKQGDGYKTYICDIDSRGEHL